MKPDAARTVSVTLHEAMTLAGALDSYLREFGEHRDQDGGVSHSEAEWQQIQHEVADLRSRLLAPWRRQA